MRPALVTYEKVKGLIEKLDLFHPECTFQIKNLQALLLLADDMTPIQRQELHARLYMLDREIAMNK